MHILLLGSGGREHALAWKIAASPLVTKLWCAPGNAGIAQEAECVPLDITDHPAVIEFCKAHAVEFVVVGPDAPIAAGIVDDLNAAGLKAFGPTKAAGRLESSKKFTKALCRAEHIPTAAYEHFTDRESAKAYIRKHGAPIVVKADGLAAGKGVVVAMTEEEALAAVDMMFGGGLGEAGAEVVIEEFMSGEEASFFALCDGEHALPRVMEEIIKPTLRALRAMGSPYQGVLYAGVMVTAEGPKLVEYNARFGDPECQVLMLRMMSDILPALIACADGQLKNFSLRWFDDAALTVIMATRGYPGDYGKGSVIEGLDDAAKVEGVEIFHAGTASKDGHIIANGGRVLNVCATGNTVTEAQRRAYAAVDRIKWPEGFCRRDIGWQAVKREKPSG
jgi:phosphoribosylamine---glycine ligase